jgi:DNA-binding MarR family transcriptional regulator
MNKINKVDSWALFFKTFIRIHQKMEDAMKEADLPDLEIYDVLWTLEKEPGHKLRFNELGKKVFISRCNITRIAERLEDQGYIERTKCATDKRGVWASLTVSGLKLRKEMWQVYGQLIQELYSKNLTQKEHQSVISIFHKIYSET